MSISRRDALLGATAAAVVTGATAAPIAINAAGVKAALSGEPVVALSQQLRAASEVWNSAIDAFEEAAHRAGCSCLVGQEVRQELGIESLWQEREHWEARFWDLRARLLETPSATVGGVLAKLRGFYHDGEIADMRAGGDPDEALPEEYAASVYRDLERLAGGLPS